LEYDFGVHPGTFGDDLSAVALAAMDVDGGFDLFEDDVFFEFFEVLVERGLCPAVNAGGAWGEDFEDDFGVVGGVGTGFGRGGGFSADDGLVGVEVSAAAVDLDFEVGAVGAAGSAPELIDEGRRHVGIQERVVRARASHVEVFTTRPSWYSVLVSDSAWNLRYCSGVIRGRRAGVGVAMAKV